MFCLRRIVPSRTPPPEPSFLRPELLATPEQALAACLAELRRVARLAAQSYRLTGETILFSHTSRDVQAIHINEQAINEIKLAMKDYLSQLTRRRLSKRQAIFLQYIDRSMSALERIGDHIETLCTLSLRRRQFPAAVVGRLSFSLFFQLYEAVWHIFTLLIQSFDPDLEDRATVADRLLAARADYLEASLTTRNHFNEEVSRHAMPPVAGMYFSEYISALDRIVRHVRNIALSEKEPQFWIKRSKLGKRVEFSPEPEPYPLVDPSEFRSRLQEEDDPCPPT